MTARSLLWSDNLDAESAHGGEDSPLMSSPEFELTQIWNECYDKLNEISLLREDWDGLGADAPERDVVDSAYKFLGILRAREDSPPQRIIANPDGSLLFEWQLDNRLRVEAEIAEPSVAEYCLKQWGGEAVFWEEPLKPQTTDQQWAAPLVAATSAAA